MLHTADCKDTPNWKDNVWRTCKIYKAYGYCKLGKFDTSDISGPGVPTGGQADKYPEKNCCVCGKGSSKFHTNKISILLTLLILT